MRLRLVYPYFIFDVKKGSEDELVKIIKELPSRENQGFPSVEDDLISLIENITKCLVLRSDIDRYLAHDSFATAFKYYSSCNYKLVFKTDSIQHTLYCGSGEIYSCGCPITGYSEILFLEKN